MFSVLIPIPNCLTHRGLGFTRGAYQRQNFRLLALATEVYSDGKLTVDPDGVITIPPEIIERRGLRSGDELALVEAAAPAQRRVGPDLERKHEPNDKDEL